MINFGELFRRALEICWSNRWLFLLGILAALGSGGGGGGWVNYSFGAGDLDPQFEQQMERFLRTLVAAWPYLLAGSIVLVLLSLLLWLLRLAARAGLIAAAAELDGEPTAAAGTALGFGRALRRGAAFLPRLVGLDLLLYGPILLLILVPLAVLIASLTSAGIVAAVEDPGALGGIVLIGITCFCLLGCLAILWQLFLAFLQPLAQRSLVLDGSGVVESVRRGWRILAANVGDVLLLVLFLFVIGLVFGALIAVILIPVGLLLAVPTFFELMQGNVPTGRGLLTLVVGGILIGLLSQLLRSFFVTYQSVAFTLAYRRLTGKGATEADLAPEPKPSTPYQFEQPPEE